MRRLTLTSRPVRRPRSLHRATTAAAGQILQHWNSVDSLGPLQAHRRRRSTQAEPPQRNEITGLAWRRGKALPVNGRSAGGAPLRAHCGETVPPGRLQAIRCCSMQERRADRRRRRTSSIEPAVGPSAGNTCGAHRLLSLFAVAVRATSAEPARRGDPGRLHSSYHERRAWPGAAVAVSLSRKEQ